MDVSSESHSTRLSRRAVLGALSVGSVSTVGCVRRARSLINRTSPEQVSLEIKTTPADSNTAAIRIARYLADHLETVGVGVNVVPMAIDELYLDMLINHQFDVAVVPHPGGRDPDFLRPLLHSRFSEEPGWQNPWGFVDFNIDELLDTQIQQEEQRRQPIIHELLLEIARKQPFTPIVFRNFIRGVRSGKFSGWNTFSLDSIFSYLALQPTNAGDTDDQYPALSVGVTDERITRNFNPLSVEFRDKGTFTDLVYEPLIRFYRDEPVPWLAESFEWNTVPNGLEVTMTIREDLMWHDGSPLRVDDIAFTYEFLADTSLDQQEITIPAPRYRGEVTLVNDVEIINDKTVSISFNSRSQDVCEQPLTIPILPEHEWRDKSALANIAGFELFEGTTEALVWDNMSPVGSGILRVTDSQPERWLEMTRFDDHFLHNEPTGIDARFHGGPSFDQLRIQVAPSDEAAFELLTTGEVDAIGDELGNDLVPQIGRDGNVVMKVDESPSFYMVGYNTRRAPLANPHFRRAVAKLIDKQYIADVIFGGFAEPTVDPVRDEYWSPESFQWDGDDSIVPFAGEEGELDPGEAQRNFIDAGYQYSSEGELLTRAD